MNAPSGDAPPAAGARLMVWWVIWASMIGGVGVIAWQLGPRHAPPDPAWGAPEAVALLLLLGSAALRWWALPRCPTLSRAFPLFVIGLALAEGCALLGIFLSDHPWELLVLGLLGMGQFAPIFATRYPVSRVSQLPGERGRGDAAGRW